MEIALSVSTNLFGVPAMAPALMSKFTGEIHAEKSCIHSFWTYPVNAVIGIVATVLQPLLSVTAIIVAEIFKLLSYIPHENAQMINEKIDKLYDEGMSTLKLTPILFVRIFNPTFEQETLDHF